MSKRLCKRNPSGEAYFTRCIEGPCGGEGCKRPDDCDFIERCCEKLCSCEERMPILETALTVAAERLYYFGHCRYEDGSLCRKAHVPTKAECIECIRNGLLEKSKLTEIGVSYNENQKDN